jgi:hypothetical protein
MTGMILRNFPDSIGRPNELRNRNPTLKISLCFAPPIETSFENGRQFGTTVVVDISEAALGVLGGGSTRGLFCHNNEFAFYQDHLANYLDSYQGFS